MCGLAGLFDTRALREIDRALLARMGRSLAHRGPDAGSFHFEAGLGLAHRRLAVIDLAGGLQPMFNEDESVVLVYNGEIYNFRELEKELRSHGHQFRTRCDTEVVVHAWEEWGTKCVERFNGMFAFALWDRNLEALFLARDRLGIKPLYYSLLPDGQLAFASELKALLQHPMLDRTLSPDAVEDYFAYGYVPDPKTILSGTSKLAPGHTLLVKRGETRAVQQRYWDVPFEPSSAVDGGSLQEELIDRLQKAVRARLIADVPLGAFLSGGVDSSAVVALMASVSPEPVKTCSIEFEDPDYNEARFAGVVAELFRTDHRTERVDSDDIALVDQLVSVYDEPFADSSSMPTYRVCQLARKVVTVALSGDGGDENFGGYRRYRLHANEARVRALIPGRVRAPLFGLLGRLYPKADWAPRIVRAKSTFESLSKSAADGYFNGVSVVGDEMRRRLFSREFRRDLQGYGAVEVLRAHARTSPTDDALSLLQYLDFKTYLPGDILTKVDRASMAHSLEVRVPILDHEFVEWVSCLPPRLKLRNGRGKAILKDALRQHLPREVLNRKKMGFSVPLKSWFRGPLRDRARGLISSEPLKETGIFQMSTIERAVTQHQSGARDNSTLLWSLLMFESFYRQVVRGDERGLDSSV